MAQLKADSYVHFSRERPDMQQRFSGSVGQVPLAPPRLDGKRAASGAAALSSSRVDEGGRPQAAPSVASVQTPIGDVRLPAAHENPQYAPTVDTLEFLTQGQGSRLQPQPARFFHR